MAPSLFTGFRSVALVLVLAAPAIAAESPDLDAFGRLPVRFNGRVTTWDAMSRAYMLHISGRDHYLDADGKRQPAVRWVLMLAAGSDESGTVRIIPVPTQRLAEQLEFEQRPADDAGVRWCSLRECSEREEKILTLARTTNDRPPHLRAAGDFAVMDLYRRLSVAASLRHAFAANIAMTPQGPLPASVAAAMRAVAQEELAPMPLTVPPHRPEIGWRTHTRGVLESIVNREKGEDLSPLMIHLFDLTVAARHGRAAEFDAAVQAYAKTLKALPFDATQSPFSFKPPEGWLESGAPPTRQWEYYADTRAPGHMVARLEAGVLPPGGNADDIPVARVDHFRSPTASDDNIINYWLFNQRLMPVGAEGMGRFVRKLRVDGIEVPYVDVTGAPDPAGRPAQRSLSVVVRRAPHTFVVSLYGPAEAVGRQQAAFEAWAGSMRFGDAKAVGDWFPLLDLGEKPAARVMGAILPAGDTVWCARMEGLIDPVGKHAQEFRAFAASLRAGAPADDKGKGPLDWTLPEGWKDVPMSGPYSTIAVTEGEEAVLLVEVRALSSSEKASLLPLVNLWRSGVDAALLKEEAAMDQTLERIKAGDREVLLLDVRTPDPRTSDAR